MDNAIKRPILWGNNAAVVDSSECQQRIEAQPYIRTLTCQVPSGSVGQVGGLTCSGMF